MSKRILFTFDDQSLSTLEEVTSDGGFSSMAEAVRCGLMILKALQRQSQDGYSRVIVEKGSKSREVILPRIVAGKKNDKKNYSKAD